MSWVIRFGAVAVKQGDRSSKSIYSDVIPPRLPTPPSTHACRIDPLRREFSGVLFTR